VSDEVPSTQVVLEGFVVTRPGFADILFRDGKAAVKFFVKTVGAARLFGPDGAILMTRDGFLRD